jgi:misacylated tRNA(Ala) deacylase
MRDPARCCCETVFSTPAAAGNSPTAATSRPCADIVAITGIEVIDGWAWHGVAVPFELHGAVEGHVDRAFRTLMSQLHTDLHLVNAFVFQAFDGALVTGVQMADDGTARIDFDLPTADNERIRALEPMINDAIRADLRVEAVYAPAERLAAEAGLLRSRSVAPPPQDDGSVRIVRIDGLDEQACGGTHLASTAQSPPIRILKIENKGRHNRRVRIGFA